ncbi:MAG TPA: DNA polymerase Y family protein [Gemmatales bacterium]|nr:DNA polymerase Y family protein [Gemmatales bacterium]
MRRIICVHLPAWPLQRLLHGQARPAEPTVIVGHHGRQPRVQWLSSRARQRGVRAGMPLAEARAVAAGLQIHEENPHADRAALAQLATWAERFTPLVAWDETVPASLLLDITGCAACFGGEERLLAAVAQGFKELGWQAWIALADTVGAAWALAHYGGSAAKPIQHRLGESLAELLALPVEGLRLEPNVLERLRKLGLDRLGQLLALPPDSVAVRFGPSVQRRLEQMFGRLAEPLVWHRPLPEIALHQEMEPGTSRQEELLAVARPLLAEAARELGRRCRGARRLACLLVVEAGPPREVRLELARPSQEADRWAELLRLKLEPICLSSPVCRLVVRVAVEEPLPVDQASLFASDALPRAWAWAALVETLTHRLGRGCVSVPRLVVDPEPERCYQTEPATRAIPTGAPISPPHTLLATGTGPEPADVKAWRHRPLRLWPQPRPLEVLALTPPGTPRAMRTAGIERQIRHAWGPERIETGWWRGVEIGRDYFMVETQEGARWWIFRRLQDGCWFWHGCFD